MFNPRRIGPPENALDLFRVFRRYQRLRSGIFEDTVEALIVLGRLRQSWEPLPARGCSLQDRFTGIRRMTMRSYILAAALCVGIVSLPGAANAFSTSAEAPKPGDPLPDPSGKGETPKSSSTSSGTGTGTGTKAVAPSANSVNGSSNRTRD